MRYLFFVIILIGCTNYNHSSHLNQPAKTDLVAYAPRSSKQVKTFDTSFYIFSDTSYLLKIKFWNLEEFNPKINNAVLCLYNSNTLEPLFTDSIFCIHPSIQLNDMNNDRVADLLLSFNNGGRANPTYHLYIIDKKNNKLRKIKGFEELPSPDLDTTCNIINSVALAGQDVFYRFYRINSQFKLVDLRHSYKGSNDDSMKYELIKKQIGERR